MTTYVDPRLALALGSTDSDGHHKRLGNSSTALQVLKGEDLGGRVALVTGANSGIGRYDNGGAVCLQYLGRCETTRTIDRQGCLQSTPTKTDTHGTRSDCLP